MNYIHRFSGRLLTIAANIHVLGFGVCSGISRSVVGCSADRSRSVQVDQFEELHETHLRTALRLGRRRHRVHRHPVLLFPCDLAAPRIQRFLPLAYHGLHSFPRRGTLPFFWRAHALKS